MEVDGYCWRQSSPGKKLRNVRRWLITNSRQVCENPRTSWAAQIVFHPLQPSKSWIPGPGFNEREVYGDLKLAEKSSLFCQGQVQFGVWVGPLTLAKETSGLMHYKFCLHQPLYSLGLQKQPILSKLRLMIFPHLNRKQRMRGLRLGREHLPRQDLLSLLLATKPITKVNLQDILGQGHYGHAKGSPAEGDCDLTWSYSAEYRRVWILSWVKKN